MNIFYTASYHGKSQYQKYFDLVLKHLEKTGANIVSPEKGNYKKLLTVSERLKLGDREKMVHYEAIRKGISQADAVVIEVSHQDFQLGHEATLAILAKKPVLCLSLFEDFSLKINNRFFYGAVYDEDTIGEILNSFIKKVKKGRLGVRFNGFLSAAQMEFLKVQAAKRRINTSEYIRVLIDKEMKV